VAVATVVEDGVVVVVVLSSAASGTVTGTVTGGRLELLVLVEDVGSTRRSPAVSGGDPP
jgi:hypothetical protein